MKEIVGIVLLIAIVHACVNLFDSGTYQSKVVVSSGTYYINDNVTLCKDQYNYNFSNSSTNTFIYINGSYMLDCNHSIINNTGPITDTIAIDGTTYEKKYIYNCLINNSKIGIHGIRIRYSLIENITIDNGKYGLYLDRSQGTRVKNYTLYNSSIYLRRAGNIYLNQGKIIGHGTGNTYGIKLIATVNGPYIYNLEIKDADIMCNDSQRNSFTNISLKNGSIYIYDGNKTTLNNITIEDNIEAVSKYGIDILHSDGGVNLYNIDTNKADIRINETSYSVIENITLINSSFLASDIGHSNVSNIKIFGKGNLSEYALEIWNSTGGLNIKNIESNSYAIYFRAIAYSTINNISANGSISGDSITLRSSHDSTINNIIARNGDFYVANVRINGENITIENGSIRFSGWADNGIWNNINIITDEVAINKRNGATGILLNNITVKIPDNKENGKIFDLGTRIDIANLTIFNNYGKVFWEYIAPGEDLTYDDFKIRQNSIYLNSNIEQNYSVNATLYIKADNGILLVSRNNGPFEPAQNKLYKEPPYIKFNVSSFSNWTIQNITQCAYITLENSTQIIENNLYGNKSDGACITVLAKNVKLEGNNYSIIGNYSGTTYGVLVENNNTNISDLNLDNYYYGIAIYNSSNSNITNIKINNTTTAISIYGDNWQINRFRVENIEINNSNNGLSIINVSDVWINNVDLNNIYENIAWIESLNNINITNISANRTKAGISGARINNSLFEKINYNGNDSLISINNLENISLKEINGKNALLELNDGKNIIIENIDFIINKTSTIIDSSNINLKNISIRNDTKLWSYSLYYLRSDGIIENSRIMDCFYGIGIENSNFSLNKINISNFNESGIIVKNSSIRINNSILNYTINTWKYGIYSLDSIIEIKNSSIENVDYKIYAQRSNITIEGLIAKNYLADWSRAIDLRDSALNITDSLIDNIFYGIVVSNTTINIWNNILKDINQSAIFLNHNCVGTIFNNNISNVSNGAAIYINDSNYSEIYSNRIEANDPISIFGSYYNKIWNNLFNFTNNPYDETGGNYWNASYNCSEINIIGGYCKGGNYWSNYNGTDNDGDGIGEQEYTIWNGPVYDYLPLTNNQNLTINNCTYINYPGEWNLITNLYGNKSDGACITINISEVTIKGNNYSIIGNYSGTTYGILNIGYNSTISNTIIKNYTYGIYSNNSEINISYLNLTNNYFGISLYNTSGILNENNICFNRIDIDNQSSNNYAINNSCDNYLGEWSESGHLVCTYACNKEWAYLYGNITGRIILGNENYTIYYWNSTKGHLFAIPNNETIDWTKILAIGKNTTDENSTNDFVELDNLLGLDHNFGIVGLYSYDGSNANKTINETIKTKKINYIPITSSTNNSRITGILWDSSDSTDDEFDETDKEDIIFYTNIEIGECKYTYSCNYELRVPRTLGEYKGSDSIELYVELK